MKIINIKATTISDAWFQTLFSCIENGRKFVIDRGSYAGQLRLEFDYITVHIKMPWVEPLEPQIPVQYNIPNPVPDGYIADYLQYLMTDKISKNEAYTYGQRLVGFEASYSMLKLWDKDIFISEPYINKSFVNQIDLLIWTYKNKGYRNNQMCLQVASPDDMLLKDPPCLRHIDTRIQSDLVKEKANLIKLASEFKLEPWNKGCSVEGCKAALRQRFCGNSVYLEKRLKQCEVPTLYFFPYFRSWDLWGGFPANLGGIELMKQYIASEIGVENGEIIASSKGLHIYSYCFELVEIIRGKTIDEFKRGKL